MGYLTNEKLLFFFILIFLPLFANSAEDTQEQEFYLLDVDKSGDVDAFTDGILILRSLVGFDGDPLIEKAVSDNCTDCEPTSISNNISELKTTTYSNISGETVYVPGPEGPQGPKGDTGDAGAAGAQGAKGDKGDTGDTGPAGAAGAQGAKGDKGDKGDTGDTGPAGAQGAKGDKGDTGAQGSSAPALVCRTQAGQAIAVGHIDNTPSADWNYRAYYSCFAGHANVGVPIRLVPHAAYNAIGATTYYANSDSNCSGTPIFTFGNNNNDYSGQISGAYNQRVFFSFPAVAADGYVYYLGGNTVSSSGYAVSGFARRYHMNQYGQLYCDSETMYGETFYEGVNSGITISDFKAYFPLTLDVAP